MRVLIIDTETTGLDPKSDHVIEVGAIVYSVEHGCSLASYASLLAAPGTKVNRSKYAARVLSLPPTYSVIGRWADQCPAGVVQKHYSIRGEPNGIHDGKFPGNYHEHELCLLSDAVAQIEAVVLPPVED